MIWGYAPVIPREMGNAVRQYWTLQEAEDTKKASSGEAFRVSEHCRNDVWSGRQELNYSISLGTLYKSMGYESILTRD